MRILLTADPEIPVPPRLYGGIERIVDGLARGLRERGHQVGLLAHPESACDVDFLAAWPGATSGSKGDTLRNALALSRAAGTFKPDLVHSFSRLAYLLALLPRLALPLVMSYQRQTGPRQSRLAHRLLGRRLRFTACSQFIADMGAPGGGQWEAIHNFVEVDRIAYAPAVAPDAPLVFLSRVESIKGPDTAIEIARASGRRLVIAGNHADSGPEGEFWRTRVAPHLGRDGVDYIGPVDDRQKSALLSSAAALLLPIRWDEPFGIVYAEALAAGTPVITSRRGAAPEIVEQGRTGFFIDSVQSGVDAIAQLPSLSREACRAAAVTRFSAEAIVPRYEALYRAHGRPGA